MERRQQQKEATAQRIFQAAAELFVRNGYQRTTVEQICAAAGVAKGTFFVHFSSKAAVVDYIGQLQMARVVTAITTDPTFASLSFRQQVLQIFAALAEGIVDQRELVLLVAGEMMTRQSQFHSGSMAGVSDMDRLLTDLVVAAQERGELRGDRSADLLARTVRNTYFSAIFDWLPQTQQTFLDIATEALDLALTGLASQRNTS